MNAQDNPPVLILDRDASAYANEISQHAPHIVCRAFTSPEDALEQYCGESMIFGQPDLVARLLKSIPCPDWVQSTWAGVKPLLDEGPDDYVLTGVKGVFGKQMSEYVIGNLLNKELQLAERAQAQQHGKWLDKSTGTLDGKIAGIMGTGSIGQHIAHSLEHFGVEVRGLSLSGSPVEPFSKVFSKTHLQEFLSGLDYLVATLPQTPQTDHLLDAEALSVLPAEAIFINVGRANVVDHGALVEALAGGKLAAAVLDVFETEPLPAESELWTTPGIHITAHIAATSMPADIVPIFLENYRRFQAGQALKYSIDFSRGY